MSIHNVYKPICLTPLETIGLYRQSHPGSEQLKMAYAGRLDPMAEGVLLLLDGDELKKRDEYQRLPKTYTVEMVLGIATDTHDIMGLPVTKPSSDMPSHTAVRQTVSEMVGTHLQAYPAFSSARVNGKPLYYWARKGELSQISVPSKQVIVHTAEITGTSTIYATELLTIQEHRLTLVKGAFRQEEIQRTWNSTIAPLGQVPLPVYTVTIACSGGTYMRSLVHEAGQKLGCGAFCLRIIRTKVGDYTCDEAIRFE